MSTGNLNRLARLVEQLHDQYASLDEFVEQITSQSSVATTDHIAQINGFLDQIKQTESELAPLREAHLATAQSFPQEIQAFVDRTVERVVTLIPRIATLEQAAVKAREQLAPVIHTSIRALDMQNAYGRNA